MKSSNSAISFIKPDKISMVDHSTHWLALMGIEPVSSDFVVSLAQSNLADFGTKVKNYSLRHSTVLKWKRDSL